MQINATVQNIIKIDDFHRNSRKVVPTQNSDRCPYSEVYSRNVIVIKDVTYSANLNTNKHEVQNQLVQTIN